MLNPVRFHCKMQASPRVFIRGIGARITVYVDKDAGDGCAVKPTGENRRPKERLLPVILCGGDMGKSVMQ